MVEAWHKNPRVNRYLEDKAMDHIDHALGRPVDPLGDTYRDHFAISGKLADEMAASPNWKERGRQGEMRFFGVTRVGRETLAAHLREIGDPYRIFLVSFEGHETYVAAQTASKAKYAYWLNVFDCLSDLTFGDFCRNTMVTPAGRKALAEAGEPNRKALAEGEVR